MPYLYLGSEKNSLDLDYLKQLNIQAILNVAAEVNNPYEYMFQSMDDMLAQAITPSPSLSKASSVSSGASSIQTIAFDTAVAYQKLPWQHNQDNLAVELTKAIDIIDRARAAGQTILVHCQCGVARSATVIIAYVMKTLKMPMQEAYNHVKRLAPPISPNLGLLFQLREFEQKNLMACIPEQIVTEEPMLVDQPKTWLYNNGTKPIKKHQGGFLLIGSWKRRLTKSTRSIFSANHDEDDGWWKTRKVSFDNPTDASSSTSTSVCC
jgi:protein-tyrosine phosphatase